nr:hypothetical protein [Sicyoidochytrium minutum DNA virus]
MFTIPGVKLLVRRTHETRCARHHPDPEFAKEEKNTSKKTTTMDKKGADNRSRQLNPRDTVYQRSQAASIDNRSQQLNPNNPKFSGGSKKK